MTLRPTAASKTDGTVECLPSTVPSAVDNGCGKVLDERVEPTEQRERGPMRFREPEGPLPAHCPGLAGALLCGASGTTQLTCPRSAPSRLIQIET